MLMWQVCGRVDGCGRVEGKAGTGNHLLPVADTHEGKRLAARADGVSELDASHLYPFLFKLRRIEKLNC